MLVPSEKLVHEQPVDRNHNVQFVNNIVDLLLIPEIQCTVTVISQDIYKILDQYKVKYSLYLHLCGAVVGTMSILHGSTVTGVKRISWGSGFGHTGWAPPQPVCPHPDPP